MGGDKFFAIGQKFFVGNIRNLLSAVKWLLSLIGIGPLLPSDA